MPIAAIAAKTTSSAAPSPPFPSALPVPDGEGDAADGASDEGVADKEGPALHGAPSGRWRCRSSRTGPGPGRPPWTARGLASEPRPVRPRRPPRDRSSVTRSGTLAVVVVSEEHRSFARAPQPASVAEGGACRRDRRGERQQRKDRIARRRRSCSSAPPRRHRSRSAPSRNCRPSRMRLISSLQVGPFSVSPEISTLWIERQPVGVARIPSAYTLAALPPESDRSRQPSRILPRLARRIVGSTGVDARRRQS